MAALWPVSFMTDASTSPKLWGWDWAWTAAFAAQLRICNGFPLKTPHQVIGFGYNSHTPHKSTPSLCPVSFMNYASTSPKLWALDRARTAVSAQLHICNGFSLKLHTRSLDLAITLIPHTKPCHLRVLWVLWPRHQRVQSYEHWAEPEMLYLLLNCASVTVFR